MLAEQCISVSELSRNTSGIIRKAKDRGIQYVFVNNKPQAVILGMEQYEALEGRSVEFGVANSETLSAETRAMYARSKALPKDSFTDF
jgi:prevent-host-death family protein